MCRRVGQTNIQTPTHTHVWKIWPIVPGSMLALGAAVAKTLHMEEQHTDTQWVIDTCWALGLPALLRTEHHSPISSSLGHNP